MFSFGGDNLCCGVRKGGHEMTKKELEQWQAVTDSSQYRWVEDRITRLNGRGTLWSLNSLVLKFVSSSILVFTL